MTEQAFLLEEVILILKRWVEVSSSLARKDNIDSQRN